MKVKVTEYPVPAMYWGSFVRVKLMVTVLGLAVLQSEPPPVHTAAGSVTTLVAEAVLTVCVPEQFVPSVAPLHVYLSAPLARAGPPVGVKSPLKAWRVMAPVPVVTVVRAR